MPLRPRPKLIELIDNANNMAVLKLWEPLLGLLESSESEIVTHAAWIIGTAVQNNLKAQAAVCQPLSSVRFEATAESFAAVHPRRPLHPPLPHLSIT
jgi:hypothetical protein